MKIFDEEKSLGIDHTTGPAVRGERIDFFRVVNNLVDGGDEFGAANGRLKPPQADRIAAGLVPATVPEA
jgi:hypothetical protein